MEKKKQRKAKTVWGGGHNMKDTDGEDSQKQRERSKEEAERNQLSISESWKIPASEQPQI